jgi:hypothetical protein
MYSSLAYSRTLHASSHETVKFAFFFSAFSRRIENIYKTTTLSRTTGYSPSCFAPSGNLLGGPGHRSRKHFRTQQEKMTSRPQSHQLQPYRMWRGGALKPHITSAGRADPRGCTRVLWFGRGGLQRNISTLHCRL